LGKASSKSLRRVGNSPSGANPRLNGFTAKNLKRHFGGGGKSDHSGQYKGYTQAQYASRAERLVRSATSRNVLGFRATDGSIVRYDRRTNDFVRSGDRGIRTMFKPTNGLVYFNRKFKEYGARKK